MQTFTYLTPERVISDSGSVEQVADELRRLGARRAFLLTTRSLSSPGGPASAIESLLGDLWAGTFRSCRQHSPRATVNDATGAARSADADAIVSFGGGSTIDTAKVVALRLGEGATELPPQIAIPTTLSAAEFTPVAGVTDEATRVKGLTIDPRIIPRVVLLDPDVTVHTPELLWLSTGVKALDHALEAVWSRRPHPMVDALALEAIRRLVLWLPDSREPENRAARNACQVAAWMSIAGMLNVGVRLSHPLGHQIGAYWEVPHGVTSCVVLPEVMRRLAAGSLEQQVLIADALGIPLEGREPADVAAEAADALELFIESLGVPTTLRETGAKREEIAEVARAVTEELRRFGRDDDLGDGESSIRSLLESVW